ncbi:MAG: 6-phosphogluconolactonase [Candidatus Altimarinota bacterium]
MKLKKFNSEEAFVNDSIALISEIIWNAQSEKGRAVIGVSGGSTPKKIYEGVGQMAADDQLDLLKTDVFLLDERMVGLDNAASNYKMIRESLYAGNNLQFLNNLHYFETALGRYQAAEKYKKELAALANLEMDAVILGIGPDGHFASIFPGYVEMDKGELVIMSETEQFEVEERLSVGPAVILNAKKILVLLKGEEKRSVVEQLLSGDKKPQEYPAMILLNHLNLEVFYCE